MNYPTAKDSWASCFIIEKLQLQLIQFPIAIQRADKSLRKARIALCMATVKAMTIATNLLGISIPERM